MKKMIIIVILFPVFFSGCYTFLNYEKVGSAKGYGIKEDDFSADARIGVNDIWTKPKPYLVVTINSGENLIKKDNFKGQKIINTEILPVFIENKDTLELVPEKTYYSNKGKLILNYFTCQDFHKKYRRNKYLYLKLEYDLDSLGTIVHKKFEYKLRKRRVMANFRIG